MPWDLVLGVALLALMVGFLLGWTAATWARNHESAEIDRAVDRFVAEQKADLGDRLQERWGRWSERGNAPIRYVVGGLALLAACLLVILFVFLAVS